jgi:hypothetical protein
LQALEILESALVIALGGGDAVLEAGEDFAGVVTEGAAEGVEIFVEGTLAPFGILLPGLGFGAAEAAGWVLEGKGLIARTLWDWR